MKSNFKKFYTETTGVEWGDWYGWEYHRVMEGIAEMMAQYTDHVMNEIIEKSLDNKES